MKLEKFTTIEDFDLPSEAPANQCMASQEWQKANESKIKAWIFEGPRETILIMTSSQHAAYGKHLQDYNIHYLGDNVLERLAYRILVLNDTDNTPPEKSKNFEICWDMRPCNEIKNDLTGSLLTVSMRYYGTYKKVLNHSF